MAAENGPTAGEYIGHHLTHWQNKPMSGVIDFSVYNLDSILWSVLLGVVGGFVPVVLRKFDVGTTAVQVGLGMTVLSGVFLVLCVRFFIAARKARLAGTPTA